MSRRFSRLILLRTSRTSDRTSELLAEHPFEVSCLWHDATEQPGGRGNVSPVLCVLICQVCCFYGNLVRMATCHQLPAFIVCLLWSEAAWERAALPFCLLCSKAAWERAALPFCCVRMATCGTVIFKLTLLYLGSNVSFVFQKNRSHVHHGVSRMCRCFMLHMHV